MLGLASGCWIVGQRIVPTLVVGEQGVPQQSTCTLKTRIEGYKSWIASLLSLAIAHFQSFHELILVAPDQRPAPSDDIQMRFHGMVSGTKARKDRLQPAGDMAWSTRTGWWAVSSENLPDILVTEADLEIM